MIKAVIPQGLASQVLLRDIARDAVELADKLLEELNKENKDE